MTTSNFFTPLRYPGGKGKLAEYLKAIVLANDLVGGTYIEPYAGGAAVALELLLLGYMDEIHINDLNPGVYAFWRSVLEETDELVELIERTPVTIEEWYKQKFIQLNTTTASLELAFSTFFLNRCNRSGILKAGVIGGKDQTGKWKLDARFNKPDLISRIKTIKRFKHQIFVHNLDAAKLIKTLTDDVKGNVLFYLDPPYYVKGKGLYDNFYSHQDHLEIAEQIGKVKSAKWVVSYDDVEAICEMYSAYRMLRYRLSYSAQKREQGGEVMFFCDALNIPEVPSSAPMHMVA
ncbi:DNA adenine methylase [Methylomonas rivi]|uniref:site-specific DNA-methyltransferase (adenine-specific) n=1 Tax=Methylomonas rivi TaxID=2952226 RepID=A0ABT1U5V7_9GAMM|nr:DNA adenine methylase [Methylomonas sp. WSC-6]MCQ8129240.1 DNA adenine methylase [Methylomonas sp. WSC-6]